MAYDPNPVRMYDSMNDSVRRANAFHDRRVQSLADFEDAERAGSLEDASLARQLARDRFTQQGEQFGQRMNLLREILSRQAPDFYADATPQAGPSAMQRGGVRMVAGRSPMPQGGGAFMRESGGAQEIDFQPELRNYLMRYLRG